jgi:outer membrane protein OmpA-like peptidoglycan-associated protein
MARWIVLAGITALLVIGYFATFYEHGQAQWRSVRFVEGELQAKARGVLTRMDAAWAKVKVDGQTAVLTGQAPSEADRDDLELAVRAAAGPGGPWLGGITQVHDGMTIAPKKNPYVWTAERTADGGIKLSGFVPGRRHQQAILAEAQKLFPAGVEDETVVAAGHPTGPWSETAIVSLQQVALLQSGSAQFAGAVVTIRGQARDADAQRSIYAAAQGLARTYEGIADVTLSSTVPLPETPKEEAAQIVPVAPAAQRLAAADCQKILDEVMTNNTIEFASRSAKLRPSSHRLLDRMAQTAVDCGTRYRITGHIDGTSVELGAGDLSQNRAEAVAEYLAAKGVAREQLVTVGADATQPAADNSTVEGQARNRRIEVSVLP